MVHRDVGARDPRGLLWSAVAATTVALLGFNALPLLVGSVIDGLHLDPGRAGLLGSVEIGAMAAASLLLAPRVGTLSRRGVALGSTAAIALAHLACVAASDFGLLVVLRLTAGLGEGALYATVNAAIAASRDPDRLYAQVTVVSALAASALFLAMPLAIGLWAHAGAFGSLAAVALLCLPLLVFLPETAGLGADQEILGGGWLGGPALAVLIAAFVLSVGEGAIWAFVERIGGHVGLALGTIGLVLAVTTVVGVSGAGLAAWIGTRFGRTLPLAAGIGTIAAAGLVLGHATTPLAFVAAELAYNTAYLFIAPFLLGTAAAVDAQGRVAAATGGAVLVGGAVGPGLGGIAVAWGSYPPLAWLFLACCGAGILLILPLLLRLDRAPARAPAPLTQSS